MLPFITAHLAWVILIGTAFIVLMGGISMLHSFIVSQRLHHLSIDVITNDAETFQHTHLVVCQTCKGKRHVSHYRYGRGNQERSVYVCYLCLPRLEQHIRQASSTQKQSGSPQLKAD